MTENNKALALLPAGFRDLLPPEAEQESQAIARLMEHFSKFSYRRVKPPFVEFEDSLFAGPGAALVQDTFRVMDPVSHRMMGVRSDITAQIARIARSRLVDEPRPLRLAYASDVLRMQAKQQRMDRQFCQVGCEIIGADSDAADIELCTVALLALQNLGIEAITLDFAVPRLVDYILDAQGAAEAVRTQIKDALAQRDEGKISKIPEAEIFVKLLALAGPADKALAGLQALDLPAEAHADIKRLAAIYEGLQEALTILEIDSVALTLDPAEHKGFEYHEHLAFTLFSGAVSGELGRGGRYSVSFGEDSVSEAATGFTLYMDTVLKAFKDYQEPKRIFVGLDADWMAVKALEKEGWVILRALDAGDKPVGCSHIYKDGVIEEIG